MAQAKGIDELLEELSDIVEKMDDENVSLEESFKLYEKGIKMCKQCNEKIDKVEKQVVVIGGNEEDGI